MNFTLLGTDPRFYHLKKRLERDGHVLTPDSENIIAPPALATGVAYWRDPVYALENAALTAEGAAELLMRRLPRAVMGADILVVGYGRIGRLLAHKLRALGAHVTVGARGSVARAEAAASGHNSVDISNISDTYDAVVNTVPAPVLRGDFGGALCMDLASAPGGWGDDTPVLKTPGLPGLYAPEGAADAMAEAIYRVLEVDACE